MKKFGVISQVIFFSLLKFIHAWLIYRYSCFLLFLTVTVPNYSAGVKYARSFLCVKLFSAEKAVDDEEVR